MDSTTFHGVVREETIGVDQNPGSQDGHSVTMTGETTTSPKSPAALESLKRAAGSWVEDSSDLDEFLEWNRRQRRGSRAELSE